uniref:MoeA C-terminal domain-containing protein n=1 Tax=Candidatus Methanogaster sp. ANME-2c ERB4 TaxID=2759911 RepID=A0A7G9YKB1_9EURY|nr:hypothetical protein BMBEPEAL_00009 [Methanosarcinales archaeon ANME-2c ERB4]
MVCNRRAYLPPTHSNKLPQPPYRPIPLLPPDLRTPDRIPQHLDRLIVRIIPIHRIRIPVLATVRKRVCRGILPARFGPEDEIRNKRKSRYLPVKLVDGVVYLTFKGSGLITSIAHADGLVAIGEEVPLTEGEVDVRVL